MSMALNPDAFAHEEIGREQAISYLRKEAVVLSETAPRGIVLLTYKQIPLGFVKNIGNRANNLYPRNGAYAADICRKGCWNWQQ